MLPAVDVIVPCYNCARYLRACVRSVLSQCGVDVRVLVIDDNSADDSSDVALELATADARVTFRRHTRSLGHVLTCDEGLEWVRAPYLALIPARDLLVSRALARATSVLEAHPAVSLVHGRGIAFSGRPPAAEGRPETPAVTIVEGHRFIQQVCGRGEDPVTTSTAVMRTEVQRKAGGYAPELPLSADLDMRLRFATHGSIAYIEAFQAYEREHASKLQDALPGRATGDVIGRQAAFTMFLERPECAIENRDQLRRRAASALAWIAFWRGVRLFESGDSEGSLEALDVAARLDPEIRRTSEWQTFGLRHRMGRRIARWLSPILPPLVQCRRGAGGSTRAPQERL